MYDLGWYLQALQVSRCSHSQVAVRPANSVVSSPYLAMCGYCGYRFVGLWSVLLTPVMQTSKYHM